MPGPARRLRPGCPRRTWAELTAGQSRESLIRPTDLALIMRASEGGSEGRSGSPDPGIGALAQRRRRQIGTHSRRAWRRLRQILRLHRQRGPPQASAGRRPHCWWSPSACWLSRRASLSSSPGIRVAALPPACLAAVRAVRARPLGRRTKPCRGCTTCCRRATTRITAHRSATQIDKPSQQWSVRRRRTHAARLPRPSRSIRMRPHSPTPSKMALLRTRLHRAPMASNRRLLTKTTRRQMSPLDPCSVEATTRGRT